MNKKIIISLLLVFSVFILSGCGEKDKKEEKVTSGEEAKDAPKENAETKNVSSGACQEEKVSLPNYGDPGKRLKNCFVEFPGEPSRQDKSYHVVEDICGQFTQPFVENLLGQKLAKIEPPKISTLSNCTYYLDDKAYIMLVLDYLKAENQKIGQEAMGRKVEKNSNIPMDNWVATQEDGEINNVYFILGPEKFISLQRSSKVALTNDKLLDFSAKLGAAIKEYK